MDEYVYVQTPACNYPYTATYSWTAGTGDATTPITVNGNIGGTISDQIDIMSKKPEHEGTYTVSVTAVL